MAGKKKKKQVANPARGFATVSVPSKPKEAALTSDEQDDSSEQNPLANHASMLLDEITTTRSDALNAHPEESKETLKMTPDEFANHLEQAELENLVDEYATRIKDDASRQVTRMNTEKRYLREQAERATVLGLTEQLWDRVSEYESFTSIAELVQDSPGVKFVEIEDVDFLVKIWALHEVVLQLHMPSIEDVLSHVLLFWKQTGHYISSDYLPGLTETLLWYACKFPSCELPSYEMSRTDHQENIDDTSLAGPPIGKLCPFSIEISVLSWLQI